MRSDFLRSFSGSIGTRAARAATPPDNAASGKEISSVREAKDVLGSQGFQLVLESGAQWGQGLAGRISLAIPSIAARARR